MRNCIATRSIIALTILKFCIPLTNLVTILLSLKVFAYSTIAIYNIYEEIKTIISLI